MRKISVLIVIFFIVAISLSGCLRAVQPESYSYVFAIGVDKGEQKRCKYTFMVQKVGEKSESGSSSSGSELFSAEGDTIYEAIDMVHSVMTGEVNFMRTGLMVIGEEVAKSGIIEEISTISFNAMKMRQSVKMLVALGTAFDFLKNLESEYRQNLTRIQFDIVLSNKIGIVPVTSYSIVSESVHGGRSDPVLTLCAVAKGAKESDTKNTTDGIIRTGGTDSYFIGSALFDGWYMTGTINENDTMYMLIARGELNRGYMTFEAEGGKLITFLIEKHEEVKSDVDLDAKSVEMKVSLYCAVEIDETEKVKEDWNEKYKAETEDYIKAQLERLYGIYKELNSDAIGIGNIVSMEFSDTKKWENYEWKKKYQEFNVSFDIELELKDKNIHAHMD